MTAWRVLYRVGAPARYGLPPSSMADHTLPDAGGFWSVEAVTRIYQQSLFELIEQAHAVHRRAHPEGEVQLCHLLSIKTGGCPEDCAYCPQSARYATAVEAQKLLGAEEVLGAAERARAAG